MGTPGLVGLPAGLVSLLLDVAQFHSYSVLYKLRVRGYLPALRELRVCGLLVMSLFALIYLEATRTLTCQLNRFPLRFCS